MTSLWPTILKAHYDWAREESELNLPKHASYTMLFAATLVPLGLGIGSWYDIGTVIPATWWIPTFVWTFVTATLLKLGRIPLHWLPLVQSGTILLLVGYGSFLSAELFYTHGSLNLRAQGWGMASASVTLLVCWVYGFTLNSHWSIPEFTGAIILATMAPIIFYPLPWYQATFQTFIAVFGHLSLGYWQWSRVQTRIELNDMRKAIEHERGAYNIVQANLAKIASGAVSRSADSTRILWEAHEKTQRVHEKWGPYIRACAITDEQKSTIESYLQSLSNAVGIIYQGPTDWDLSVSMNYAEACFAATKHIKRGFPKVDVDVADGPVLPDVEVSEELQERLETLGFDPSLRQPHAVHGMFIGGVDGLALCLALIARSAIRVGASKVLLASGETDTHWWASVSDNGPGMPRNVIRDLYSRGDQGQQHVSMWTVARLSEACGGKLSFDPLAQGTRVTISVEKTRAIRRPQSATDDILEDIRGPDLFNDSIYDIDGPDEDPHLH